MIQILPETGPGWHRLKFTAHNVLIIVLSIDKIPVLHHEFHKTLLLTRELILQEKDFYSLESLLLRNK